MLVRSITLGNFMSHDRTTVALPERGLVLVSGRNGGGKSAIIEGVAWACWGRTLRGSDPWRSDGELCRAFVSLGAEGFPVERVRKKRKSLLSFGHDGASYESATKAQEALDATLGTFDLWRRTHVFSSADAAHFTLATDAERKRLLERLLVLDRFDSALEACRKDRKMTEQRATNARHTVDLLEASFAEQGCALESAETAMGNLPPEPPPVAQQQKALANAESALRARVQRLKELRADGDAATNQAAHHEAAASAATRQLTAFRGDPPTCSACRQVIPADQIAGLRRAVEDARTAAQGEREAAATAREAVRVERGQVEEDMASLQAQIAGLREEIASAEKALRTRQTVQSMRDAARQRVIELMEKRSNAAVECGLAEADLALHETVEQVLGLKGVRAHVLGKALAGIEAVANYWLARIAGPDLRLKLEPFSEKVSGGVSDAIAVKVAGAGGGQGYQGASQGERRRIDIALVVALAVVAQAGAGSAGSTLWFDEVFDALDDQGVEAVASALVELAQDRPVVVISHSHELLGSLEPRAALHVRCSIARV